MNNKYAQLFIMFFVLFLAQTSLFAQTDKIWDPEKDAVLDGKSILKANLTGLALRNYGFYAERILNKRISLVLGVNKMPEGTIPYLNKFIDPESFDDIEGISDIRISSFSIAPEMRFYLSRSGFGKGFYVAPYYKFEHFGASNYHIEFIDENNINQEIKLNGNLNTHSFGAAIGAQWLLGKRKNIALDWLIIGAHYGGNKGHFDGESTYVLSENDQIEAKKIIEDNLNGVKIGNLVPIRIENLEINAREAQVDISSPWAFIRTAISVGFRF